MPDQTEPRLPEPSDPAPLYIYSSRATSAYFRVIGPPPVCGPADYQTALDYTHKIEKAIAMGGWTEWETTRLRQMHRKWTRRALGKDPRFNMVGTRNGRLPAQLEHELRLKQRRASPSRATTYRERMEARFEPGGQADQRSNRERRYRDADLPTGRAKGLGGDVEPDLDMFEPEAGEMELPKPQTARQYLIVGQDTKGHSHRVYCRISPPLYRAVCVFEKDRGFGFRTIGDVIRWCIDFGIRELLSRRHLPQAKSALAQNDAIREILLDEQYYQEFPQVFEQMTEVINRHLNSGAEGEAIRVIGKVRYEIEQMDEPYWREKYLNELMGRYGKYLEAREGAALEFGGDE